MTVVRTHHDSLAAVMPIALTILCSFASHGYSQDAPKSETRPAQIREEQGVLPKYADLPVPEAEELLRGRPFDWVVLKTQEVLTVEPLPIRPDMLGQLAIRHDMAQQSYNRVLKHKPYKEAELTSLRQYWKNDDRKAEFEERESQLKQELDTSRERVEGLKGATYKVVISLLDGSVDPDYVLEARYIDFVVYYEDLLLRRADLLIAEGRVPLAYDLLLVVAKRARDNNALIESSLETEEKSLVSRLKSLDDERAELRKSREALNGPKTKNSPAAKMRITVLEKTIVAIATEMKDVEDELRSIRFKLRFRRPKDFPNPEPPRKDDLLLPTWPKFDEVYQRLIFKDADQRLEQGQTEEALRLLEELWQPGVDIPELPSRLGRVVDRRIKESGDDYRQIRHFLADLATRYPSNPTVIEWRETLIQRAAKSLQQARDEATAGQFANAARSVDLAARIWPEAAGLKEAHRELTERYQILRVGVLDLPGRDNPLTRMPSEAQERANWLTEARLFEPTSISDQGVRYRSSFFESWEPTDLGRRVQFRLKLKRADWEARPLITSSDVYGELMARVDPGSKQFDERLAGFVDGITVLSPTEFSVKFRQLPLRPEALWQLTVAVSEPSRPLNDDISAGESASLGRQRFQEIDRTPAQIRYGRVRRQSSSIRSHHVDEIVEVHYDNWDRALQGLLRGDISAVPSAGLKDLKGLQDDGRFFVVPYAQPRSHLLFFNPQNQALHDGQFRRAIMHAVPREQLLNNVVLRDIAGSHARLITGPFSSNSYGYNRQLPQAEFDPALAAALALTAKKQLGGTLPALRMTCPDDARSREVAQAMIEHWRRVGIEVQLREDAGSSDEWDICYQTVKSVEPLMDIWPLLTLQPSARVDALQTLSEPTRRLLLELERTVDWTTATKLLHRLLTDLLIEARYVPLWEVDEYLVVRKNVSGVPTRLMHPYSDVERWTVQSWYPTDTP